MGKRILVLMIIIVIAAVSAWLLYRIADSEPETRAVVYHGPDYYMEDFVTTTINSNGTPKSKLNANYMAHYPENDTTELLKPEMEIFRENKMPLFIVAEKGWVTSDNEVILLTGNVELWENNVNGIRVFQVNTENAQVLLNQEYAETEDHARIISGKTIMTGKGMRAHFDNGILEILSNVHTTIEAQKNQ